MGLMNKHFLCLLAVAAAQPSSPLSPEQLKPLTSSRQQHRPLACALFRRCRLALLVVAPGRWPTVRGCVRSGADIVVCCPRLIAIFCFSGRAGFHRVLRCRALRDLCAVHAGDMLRVHEIRRQTRRELAAVNGVT